MVQMAMARWQAAGISAEAENRLRAVTFEVADLPGDVLAVANENKIQGDVNGAGYGWFVDLTPEDDTKFDVPVPGRELQTTEYSPAVGQKDFLTVVMRQLG